MREPNINEYNGRAGPLVGGGTFVRTQNGRATATDKTPRVTAPVLRFDWCDWMPYLEDETATEQQKRELIENLWSIVVAFVDLGWRVEASSEIGEALDLCAILSAGDSATEEK